MPRIQNQIRRLLYSDIFDDVELEPDEIADNIIPISDKPKFIHRHVRVSIDHLKHKIKSDPDYKNLTRDQVRQLLRNEKAASRRKAIDSWENLYGEP